MKPRYLFEEELAEIPARTFVVTFWGQVGVFVRFTGKRGLVKFGAQSAYYKCLRYATQDEVNVNLPGLVKEQTS